MKTDSPPTFSHLLREGDRFTDRDIMKVLSIGHPALKRRELDPSLFTVGELLRLATLLGRPIAEVLRVVLAEVARNDEAAQQRATAVEQVAGRKYHRRLPPGD